MIGEIAGDIIGSVYERHNIKTTDFPLFDEGCTFTDDTVLTLAVADAILNHSDYGEKLKEYFVLYPVKLGPGLAIKHFQKNNSGHHNIWCHKKIVGSVE